MLSPLRIIAIIQFSIFVVLLVVMSSLIFRNLMMKTERTAIMIVKPAIIVVVRVPADYIRPVTQM